MPFAQKSGSSETSTEERLPPTICVSAIAISREETVLAAVSAKEIVVAIAFVMLGP